jgi:dienelactone hydrolase
VPELTATPKLRLSAPRGQVRAAVLVLHGGRETNTEPVRATNLAALRMRPFAAALHSAGSTSGLAVARLRFAVRGWNGDLRSPVADAQAALAQLAQRFPGVPIALVGHSMGGRTALHVADHPNVRAVVGLAPWVTADEPVTTLAGRRLLVVHGEQDKMTSPRAAAAYTKAAAAYALSASFVSVRNERHAMLRRPHVWQRLTTGFVMGALLETPADGTDDGEIANVVLKALAGEPVLVV